LNEKGESEGVAFKKGRIQYWNDGTIKYKLIICSCVCRNYKYGKKKKDYRGSLEEEKTLTEEECPAFYRIKYEKATGKFLGIVTSKEQHQGHELKLKREQLTPLMIEEIKNFKQNTSVIQIKEFLEQRFKVDLSYKSVYNEFRKIFPLLGPNDAQNFTNWCEKNNFIVEKVIDEDNRNYTKLFICSQLMKAHFKAYGDVVIVDSTYRVNRYKLPIVLFSGFTHSGRNCLFGIGVVNDETENTYNWLFSSFFKTHRNLSKIIVTDHDLAMESVLNSTFPSITHLLCKWHIIQSFTKNFSFLTAMNCVEIKEKILALPYVECSEEFEAKYDEIKQILISKKFNRSVAYLEKMYNIKQKWAEAFLIQDFTGGTHTTSRAESMNALLKKYCSSKSEMSDFIEFLEGFEKKFISEEINNPKETLDQYGSHPIILELKKSLSSLIFSKHFDQFVLGHNYLCQYQKTENDCVHHQVINIYAKKKSRLVRIQNNFYQCKCSTFIRHGIICRHIFALMMMFQDKNLEKVLIHKRWKVPELNENSFEFPQLDQFNFSIIKKDEQSQQKVPNNQITFKEVKRTKGAPRKEKRPKSVIEKGKLKKKVNSKKSQKEKVQKNKSKESF